MSQRPTDAEHGSDRDRLPVVGVVVLNWNSSWFTQRCIRSLARSDYPADRTRIVLVDNGSVDGSLEELCYWLDEPGAPGVEILANDENLGFAEGCNRGIRKLMGSDPRPDWVALLNNDARCETDWLSEMVRIAGGRGRVGAVASSLVLEPGFVAVDVKAGRSAETVERVEVSPLRGPVLDVTGGVRTSGFSDEGALMWPAQRLWQLTAGSEGRIWVPVGDGPGRVLITLRDDEDRLRPLEETIDAASMQPRKSLLNGIGTDLNDSGEGSDIGYGLPEDDPGIARDPQMVDGFCGGAALLNAEALEEVGLFDPRYFAYYEDTDLSWRLRRAGWGIVTAPGAVVHHAFGASFGGGSRLHVFLDRRNWLLTNVRNADPTELRRALGWLRRGTWRLFRVNVFGRLRRGTRPQLQPLATWKLAVVSAVAGAPRVLLARRPGRRPTTRVRSALQPGSSPKAPTVTPGGPLLVHLDVGETLKAGYRAGIQRVVCRLAAELSTADPRLQLVPIRWCERNRAFRRLTSREYESLLRSGAGDIADGSAPGESAKASVRSLLGALGIIDVVRRLRELVFGRRRRATEDSLVLDGLPAGSVLLELDAVWNELGVDRSELLGDLRDRDVHVATFVHDLFPIESPQWFSPELRRIFEPTVRAQLRRSELIVCASGASAAQVLRVCRTEEIPEPRVATIRLGADPPDARHTRAAPPARPRAAAPAFGDQDRYLLMVGTVETRKNHLFALEVFEQLTSEFPDLHLVIAGRYGWGADEFLERFDSSEHAATRLHWFTEVGDQQLEDLYRGAHTVLVPSLAEGFGLPVVEALMRDVPVVASDDPALAEAGGSAVTCLPIDDAGRWVEELASRLGDEDAQAHAVQVARGFRAPTWQEAASGLAGVLCDNFAW